jgi:1-acyl-sn-glycerol-3-phosphate acyltransferase
MVRLVGETEAACDALLVEAARSPKPPPLPASAVKRLGQLGVDRAG